MTFFEKVTGSDMTKEMKAYEKRMSMLPNDYQETWTKMKDYIYPHSDLTGRKLMPVFEGLVGLLEEAALDNQSVEEVFGKDIQGFCLALLGESGVKSFHDKWRDQLNNNVKKKLAKWEEK